VPELPRIAWRSSSLVGGDIERKPWRMNWVLMPRFATRWHTASAEPSRPSDGEDAIDRIQIHDLGFDQVVIDRRSRGQRDQAL